MRSFIHIYHTYHPLGKERSRICVFLTKSGGYKHNIQKFVLNYSDKATRSFFNVYHTKHPLGMEVIWNLHEYKRPEKPPPSSYLKWRGRRFFILQFYTFSELNGLSWNMFFISQVEVVILFLNRGGRFYNSPWWVSLPIEMPFYASRYRRFSQKTLF